MKNFKGVRIEYHIIQSFPVVCLNRDDVGAPKTAIVGGVERGRVSSQCWKRQVRMCLHDLGVKIAVRTKRITDMVISKCQGEMTEEKANFCEYVSKCISKDTLLFFSEKEAIAIAEYVDKQEDYGKALKIKDKDILKALKNDLKEARPVGSDDLEGLDIALFGRMIANAADLNVEAASSFSHAITTHAISSSIDFFTAVDDCFSEEESGSGHLGTNEFTSGTYYRYIALDLGLLSQHFDVEDMDKAIDVFTKALFLAVPAARQTTFSGACPWNYARVLVRRGQGLQLSWDKPVKSKGSGYVQPSIERLDEELEKYKSIYGSIFGGIADFEFGNDKAYSIDELCKDLVSAVNTI